LVRTNLSKVLWLLLGTLLGFIGGAGCTATGRPVALPGTPTLTPKGPISRRLDRGDRTATAGGRARSRTSSGQDVSPVTPTGRTTTVGLATPSAFDDGRLTLGANLDEPSDRLPTPKSPARPESDDVAQARGTTESDQPVLSDENGGAAGANNDVADEGTTEEMPAADAPAGVEGGAPGFQDGVQLTPSPSPFSRRRGRPGRDGAGTSGDDQEDTNLDRSRAGRRGGGGGPTDEEEEEDEADDEENFKSDLLVRALGLEDSPYGAFGWLQASFTGNPAHPRSGENFGVNPNSRSNAFLFQQFYFVFEKRLDPARPKDYDWGFRTDNLFGTDWDQFHAVGLFDGAFRSNHFGYDPVQFYGEVHLPWITEGGIDVKGGRFYALAGYEDGRAPARPLNSGGYLFGFAHPFTHFGMMTTWHVTDRINLYNGAVNGWDRWINENYRWGYAGGVSWDSEDDRTNVTLTFNAGPNQFPRFFRQGYNLTLNGVTPPPFLAGRRNLAYSVNNAFLFTGVLIHEWTDKFTVIVENDEGVESNIPGLGPGGSTTNSQWYGLAGWFLYKFHEELTGVYRAEVFRDNHGVRTGFDNTFYEMTLGLIWKPRTWFWVRPEIRWDWTSGTPCYNDDTSKHQLTLGFDAIFLF
jgi:hypothetical protein